jgi:hypothetical protein
VPLTGLEVENHVLVIGNSNEKNISYEQNIFLHQDCAHSGLCHNNNNNITIMNVVSSGLEVLSYVTHSFCNNEYLNSKVGIILGLYIQISLHLLVFDPTLPFNCRQSNAVLKVGVKLVSS